MSALPLDLPLSALSIPGTHNSHAHYRALPSVRFQSTDIQTQLTNGIRFLDIRLQPVHASDPTKQDIHLVHGAFPITLTGPKSLAPILQTCYTFLAHHPTETILLSPKPKGPPTTSSTAFYLPRFLEEQYIRPNPHK
ncbi:PLC-like phosphodiesterase [Ampelomyces quisqualis]|uniref:PLC-like phosphodiesterase n=1 Tax=Ampelomyces quisqualis TaxID=50730 RepID=A0A6A5QAF2_AMPQU|nr:PLC-like phosphodiesterase [Ampelomyces quisqualis]